VGRRIGFSGFVAARAQYLNSGNRYLVSSQKLEGGKPIEEWIDEGRLMFVEA
jgi:hypothetical protein